MFSRIDVTLPLLAFLQVIWVNYFSSVVVGIERLFMTLLEFAHKI